MNTSYLYSVLTYHHNHSSNEVVNVGVLALFPLSGEVYFLLPERAALKRRLQHLYPDAAHHTVWAYLRSFENQAERISKKIGIYSAQYSNLISEQFLTDNGSSLRFAELEASPVWKGTEESLSHLHDRFLAGYGAAPTHRGVTYNEAYIIRKVKTLIAESFGKVNGKDVRLYLREEKYELKEGPARISGNQQWKNGTLNLIHPLSLDVKTDDTIYEKCLYLAKSAEILKNRARSENLNVHCLVSRPNNDKLVSAYEESVKVLESASRETVKVILPEKWEEYASEVASKAIPFP